MEILLALVDFIPVALFFIAMVRLQKCLYSKMYKYSFALLATGSIMVLAAGCLKAFWKIMYYGFKIDLYHFNYMFFPNQAIGFVLIALGLMTMIFHKKKEMTSKPLPMLFLASTIVPEDGYTLKDITMVFVFMQVLGCLGLYLPLSIIAHKMKKKALIVIFVVAFFLMMMMGFFSTRISRSEGDMYILWNWVAEVTNILAEGLLLFGVLRLEKAGLKDFNLQ